ncbi:MAG TPA: hypothetical protein VL069_00620, partial [Opitutus sp.]|nr:hypothetical protein [Opitutus sp.]
TLAAVQETRLRRQVQIDAAHTTSVKTQWVQTLGSVEEALSITDIYQAQLQGMQNKLTALAGIAEVMDAALANERPDLVRAHAAKNKVVVTNLLTELTGFMSGPFAQASRLSQGATRSTANSVLGIVRKHFHEIEAARGDQRTLSVVGLVQDMYIAARPLKLLIALRHLIEFCFARNLPKSAIKLTASCIERPITAIDSLRGPKIVLTENTHGSGACIVFCVTCQLASVSLQNIQQAFRDYPENPHKGNLQMIAFAMRDELAAVTVHVDSTEATVFQLYAPLAV